MTATDNLNEKQFGTLYHGTAARLRPGDMIQPGHTANWSSDISHDPKREHVYATDNISEAYWQARNASQRQGPDSYGRTAPFEVYEVQPTGQMKQDPAWQQEEGNHALAKPRASPASCKTSRTAPMWSSRPGTGSAGD